MPRARTKSSIGTCPSGGTFALVYDQALITEVDVRFTALGADSTRVDFEHRNLDRFGDLAAKVGPMMDQGWGAILQSFCAVAAG